jgi:hypothetical protein
VAREASKKPFLVYHRSLASTYNFFAILEGERHQKLKLKLKSPVDGCNGYDGWVSPVQYKGRPSDGTDGSKPYAKSWKEEMR